MEIKVDLSPEQINQTIADAIAKSAIGDQLERIIKETIAKLSSTYSNPIQAVVERYVNDEIAKLLHTTYADQIREAVKAQVTEEIVTALVAKVWDIYSRRLS